MINFVVLIALIMVIISISLIKSEKKVEVKKKKCIGYLTLDWNPCFYEDKVLRM